MISQKRKWCHYVPRLLAKARAFPWIQNGVCWSYNLAPDTERFFMELSTMITRAQQQRNATATQFDSSEFFVRRVGEYEITLSVLRASSYEPGWPGWPGFRDLGTSLDPLKKISTCPYERAVWLGCRDLGFSNRDLGKRAESRHVKPARLTGIMWRGPNYENRRIIAVAICQSAGKCLNKLPDARQSDILYV